MVRTKAGGGSGAFRKVLAARAPRKVLGSSSLNAGPSPAAKRGEGRRVGGNPVCVRPVPAWQRGIGEFLRRPPKENRAPGGEAAGSSGLEPAAGKARPVPPDPPEDGESSEEEQPSSDTDFDKPHVSHT
ncbi:PCNA-associated factor [Opisthocomus hoazin]|uniref:PCNA-associated factor n=1 Tax=Opisthocomus hoazin TaxID=30419 RepID=UPI003F52E9F9